MSRGIYKIDLVAVARLLQRRPELLGIGVTEVLDEMLRA